MNGYSRLFIDIETMPNIVMVYKTGKMNYLHYNNILVERCVCVVCFKWEGQKKVHALTWDKNQCDKEMLRETIRIMDSADQIVAHNGDRFDIKWLRGRALFHNIPMKPHYASIDTLKLARQQFNLNSYALDYLSKYTKTSGKIDYGGIETIKKLLLKNNRAELKRYVNYCKDDVVKLEELFEKLKPYTTPKIHRGVANYGSRIDCPECGSTNTKKNGRKYLLSGAAKQELKCHDCGTYWTVPLSVFVTQDQERRDREV